MIIIDWFFTIFMYIEQPVKVKCKNHSTMEQCRITKIEKSLFELSLILGILDKKFRKPLERIGNIITFLIFLLICGGIYFMLPNCPMFIYYDDYSCTKGKIFFAAFVTALVCELINQIINRDKQEKREKRFGIILAMFIACILILALI